MLPGIHRHFLNKSPLNVVWRTRSYYNNVFSGDLNNVTLLGTVASTGVTVDKLQSGGNVAVFNLLTRARYRSANRFMMKLVYHRIHVFDEPLVERIKNVTQGDRVCVTGCLTSFKKTTNDWMQCVTAQNVILHTDAGKSSEAAGEEDQNDF